MNRTLSLLKALYADEGGQDLIEYALIATLVALVAITGLNGLASSISSEYNSITSRFGNAVS
jgi:pilus assembly protein Flp/PilA